MPCISSFYHILTACSCIFFFSSAKYEAQRLGGTQLLQNPSSVEKFLNRTTLRGVEKLCMGIFNFCAKSASESFVLRVQIEVYNLLFCRQFFAANTDLGGTAGAPLGDLPPPPGNYRL